MKSTPITSLGAKINIEPSKIEETKGNDADSRYLQ